MICVSYEYILWIVTSRQKESNGKVESRKITHDQRQRKKPCLVLDETVH